MLVCLWLMFNFTEYVAEALARYQLAWYFMGFIAVNIGVNVLVLAQIIVMKVYQACRKKMLTRKAKKMADLRVQQQQKSKLEEVQQDDSSAINDVRNIKHSHKVFLLSDALKIREIDSGSLQESKL